MIMLELPAYDGTVEGTLAQLDAVYAHCRETLEAKSSDYGESWRQMRRAGVTDLVGNKVARARQLERLEALGGTPKVQESLWDTTTDQAIYSLLQMINLALGKPPL